MTRSRNIERRELLTGLAFSSLCFVFCPRLAKASAAIIEPALELAETRIEFLGNIVVPSPVPLLDETKILIVNSEHQIVYDFSRTFQEFEFEDYKQYFSNDIESHLKTIVENDIAFVQKPESVKRLPIARVTGESENLPGLLVDIIADTLELKSLKTAIQLLVNEYRPVRDAFNDLSRAVINKDWEKCLDLLSYTVELIISDKALGWLEERLGPGIARRLKIDLLKSTVKRLVPFFGWGLFAFGLIYAIKNNWERIQQHL